MVVLPAWCPNCRKMVQPRTGGIEIRGALTNISFGIARVQCPHCDGPAELSGTFDVDEDGIIHVIAGSQWTREKIAEFQSALRWAADNYDRDPEAAVRRVESVDPQIATLLRRIATIPNALAFIAILVGLLAWLFPRTPDQGSVKFTPSQINQYFCETPRGDQSGEPSPPSSPGTAETHSPEPPAPPHPPPAPGSPS
jgi:hypothetical protein